jgi:hypothetical protein
VLPRSFPIFSAIALRFKKIALWSWSIQHRERLRLSLDMTHIVGLMQLLMKQRNGYRWSAEDRQQIRKQLRKLASLSPYLFLFVAPGGFIVLPILAWWVDRRRQKREAEEEAKKSLSK